MKNIKNIVTILVTMPMMLLSSCSNIGEDERLIYVAPVTPPTPEKEEVIHNVLIEDFTGQKCVNCPNATAEIDKLIDTYGDSLVIPVAIHSGPFGRKTPLYTALGDTYWNTWFSDTQGQPIVKINRGSTTDNIPTISKLVSSELSKLTKTTIDANCTFDSETRQLAIETSFQSSAEKAVKLQLWLTEDSIVGVQRKPDGTTDKQYIHMHVLREAINGDWGEDVAIQTTKQSVTHTCTLTDNYKVENCFVVAFLYDNTEGVIQVVKSKVSE